MYTTGAILLGIAFMMRCCCRRSSRSTESNTTISPRIDAEEGLTKRVMDLIYNQNVPLHVVRDQLQDVLHMYDRKLVHVYLIQDLALMNNKKFMNIFKLADPTVKVMAEDSSKGHMVCSIASYLVPF